MANHFSAKGDKVCIISVSSPGEGKIFNLDNRVKVDYLNINPKTGSNLTRKIKSVFATRDYFSKIKERTFLLGMGTYPTLLISLLPKTNHLITIGCQHGSYAAVKHLWRILRRLLYHRLSGIVSLTNSDVARLQKLNPTVCVIPNSVTFFPGQPAGLNSKLLLSIGRIDYQKGYDLLLEVFSRFCAENNDWQLRIIGDGPLRETIRRKIADKHLVDRITMISSSNPIEKEYLNASIYIMTSRTEGLPMVLLEAQACGLPTISFNCQTGPADIINDGRDGYLIDNFDIDEMKNKLAALCADSDKRSAFGAHARMNIKKFFPEPVFNKWEIFFNQLQ